MAMPWAMLQLREHLALALTMCVLLGLWSCYTMVLLYDCVVLAWPEAHGYSELVVKALGAPGGVLCAVNLVLHQILCVAAYLVFVADSLKDVFGGTTAVYIAAATPPVVLLCWLRDVRALGPASAIGTAALLAALCVIVYEGCASHTMPTDGLSDAAAGRMLRARHASANLPSLAALGSFAGITTFTFCGHSEVVTVVRSFGVAHPRDAPYRRVVVAMGCVAIPAVLAFALSAMRCFGDGLAKNVLLSVHSRTAALLKLLMAAAVLASCALKMFPAFDVLESALGIDERARAAVAAAAEGGHDAEGVAVDDRLNGAPHACDGTPGARAAASALPGGVHASVGRATGRYALRTTLVLLSAVLSLACPDFEFFTAFVGAFCNSLICFVLPPLMYAALLWEHASPPLRVLRRTTAFVVHTLLASLGLVVLVGGTTSVLREKLMHPSS